MQVVKRITKKLYKKRINKKTKKKKVKKIKRKNKYTKGGSRFEELLEKCKDARNGIDGCNLCCGYSNQDCINNCMN